jgi:hypothetical protein
MEKKPNYIGLISLGVLALIILAAIFSKLGGKLTFKSDGEPQPSPSPIDQAAPIATASPVIAQNQPSTATSTEILSEPTPSVTPTPNKLATPEIENEIIRENRLALIGANGESQWELEPGKLELGPFKEQAMKDYMNLLRAEGIRYDQQGDFKEGWFNGRLYVYAQFAGYKKLRTAILNAEVRAAGYFLPRNEKEIVLENSLALIKANGESEWNVSSVALILSTTSLLKQELEDYMELLRTSGIKYDSMGTEPELLVWPDSDGYKKLRRVIFNAQVRAARQTIK